MPNGYRWAHLLLCAPQGRILVLQHIDTSQQVLLVLWDSDSGILSDMCRSCQYTRQFCAGDLAVALVLVLVNPAILTGISEEVTP